jgi:1,4-dihydroxy-2-naphthoyl-CoA synthase
MKSKKEELKGLIITGNGKVFCSGGDIKDMVDGNLSGWKMKDFLTDNVHKIANYMENFPKPTLAAINGAAMGAGLDMALMCDFRIASEKAFFAETYIKLGLVAGDGGAYLLPRIIGLPRALEMLLTGEPINANYAKEIGLINDNFSKAKLKADMIYVDINLHSIKVDEIVKFVNKRGFFYSGILFYRYDGMDYLRLQYENRHKIEEKLNVCYSKYCKNLTKFILKDKKRVKKFVL